jgi:hypothetical protein
MITHIHIHVADSGVPGMKKGVHKVTLAQPGLSSRRKEHEYSVEAGSKNEAQQMARKQHVDKLGPGASTGFRVIRHEETAPDGRITRHV